MSKTSASTGLPSGLLLLSCLLLYCGRYRMLGKHLGVLLAHLF